MAPPPSIVFSPQITVQSAPLTFWRTWLPVGVAMMSAGIAAGSAWLAWRNQVFGFAKDAAAIAREARQRQAQVAVAAFENSVARPVGMALDLIERLGVGLGRLRPVNEMALAVVWSDYSAGLTAEHNHGLRLCREADASLAPGRTPVFAWAFVGFTLDDTLLAAAGEALTPAVIATDSAYDAALEAIVAAKVEVRRLLEAERMAEVARNAGPLAADPFYAHVQRWLPRSLRTPGD